MSFFICIHGNKFVLGCYRFNPNLTWTVIPLKRDINAFSIFHILTSIIPFLRMNQIVSSADNRIFNVYTVSYRVLSTLLLRRHSCEPTILYLLGVVMCTQKWTPALGNRLFFCDLRCFLVKAMLSLSFIRVMNTGFIKRCAWIWKNASNLYGECVSQNAFFYNECVCAPSESQVPCKMNVVQFITLTLYLWTVLHPQSLPFFSFISSIPVSSSPSAISSLLLHHILFLYHCLFHDNPLSLSLPFSVSPRHALSISHKFSSTSQVLLLDSSRFRHSLPCHLLVIPPPHSLPFSLHPLTCKFALKISLTHTIVHISYNI